MIDKSISFSIATLNYDSVAFDILQKSPTIDTGFSKKGSRYPPHSKFDFETFNEHKYVLYWPHGNARLVFSDTNREVYLFDSEVNAFNKRMQDPNTSIMSDGNNKFDFNSFITTGISKDSSLSHPFFATYYSRLAVDLTTSDIIIAIGYSFNDPHIDRFLYYTHSRGGKIVVVDYFKVLNFWGAINGSVARDHTNNQQLSNLADKLNVNAFCEEGLHKLRDDGFGEIINNVYYYRLGIDDFLSSYEELINGALNS